MQIPYHFLVLILAGFLLNCTPRKEKDPGNNVPDLVQYVNPLMGTASTFAFSHGNVYPAAGMPWGMNTWTPQTGELGSGWIYQYQKDSINGFRQTHQPSPWMNDYGTFAVMPVSGNLRTGLAERASSFRHQDETARPHYYRVWLKEHQINAEIVPTERAAMLRFTPRQSGEMHIVVDIFNGGGSIEIIPEERKITGFSRYNSGGVPDNFANYFELRVNMEIKGYGTWLEDKINPADPVIDAGKKHAGSYITLEVEAGNPVELTCASSFISPEQAALNLQREAGGITFDELRQRGFERWNAELYRIQVVSEQEEKLKTFYSTLYRTLLFPRIFYEFDQDGKMVHYSPYDGKIHEGYMYSDNGFWDTFRAVFPFFTLMYPEKDATIMKWLVNAWKEGGWLPIWPSPGYRKVMIGAHTASLFADAMVKGIRDFDMDKALMAVVQDAFVPAPSFAPGRDGMEDYNSLGFVPYPDFREASAKTLEYAYDDFCISQMATVLGKDSLTGIFKQRATNYKNVFHRPSMLMRGRKKDGSFLTEFSPLAWGGPFTEGNAWQYTWSVFHDPRGLMNLMGGRENFIMMMDSVFSQPPDFEIGTYPYEIHEITEMVAADMGQYAHGNQPVQHMIYLYNYAGQPWKAQYWIREVLDRLYRPVPEGYCGDEDNGQTSAWYVFSAMGFYPVCPGVPEYVLGSPLFEKVIIQLPGGKKLTIEATGDVAENRYIRSISFNGRPWRKTWLSHEDLLRGGKLEFEMTDQPADPFDDDAAAVPFSMSAEKR